MSELYFLAEFGPNIWSVEGPKVMIGTFVYRTRMAVIRLLNCEAWVWSPVELSEQLAQEVETVVGPVRHIVSPNKLHHLNLRSWAARFPKARVYAPPGLKGRAVVKDVPFSDELGDEPLWEDIDQVIFHNRLTMEEVVFFHKPSRTALFCDLIQRYTPEEAHGWRGLKRRMDGLVGEPGGTPREWIWSFLFNLEKAQVARRVVVKQWIPERLLIAHGECLHEGAAAVVASALRWAE